MLKVMFMSNFFGLDFQSDIRKLELSGTDILNKGFQGISIYSNLFHPFLTANVIYKDVYDIIKNKSIQGNELLQIEYSDIFGKKVYNNDFVLNNIIDSQELTSQDKTKDYIFSLSSKESVPAYKSISRRLIGNSKSIIGNILSDNLSSTKTCSYSTLTITHDIQTNYNNSLWVIDYLSKNDNCFFYEVLEGFNYKSFSDMCNQGETSLLNFFSNQSQMLSPETVKLYKFSNYFNNEFLLKHGAFKSKFINFDKDKYKINKSELSCTDVTNGLEIGNRDFFVGLDNNLSNVSCKYGNLGNRLKRFIEVFNVQSHVLEVKTNADLSRKVGDIVYCDYYGIDNSNNRHDMYNGRWLVIGIKYEMTRTSFSQFLQLAKVRFDK